MPGIGRSNVNSSGCPSRRLLRRRAQLVERVHLAQYRPLTVVRPGSAAFDVGPVSALQLDQGPDLGIRGTSQRIPQTR